MKVRTLIPLIIGLGVGFFAIKMGIDMVQKAKGAQGEETMVLISSKQIQVASKITEPLLGVKKVPASLVPADAFTESKSLIGRVTSMTIAPGVPITAGMLAPPGSEPGLAAIIPPGMRAVAVSVNEESSVAGFITPGSRVDVSAVSRDNGPAKLSLSDIEVGAVGQSLSRVGEDGKTVRMEKSVTLFLKPEEVQVLHAFTGGGRIRLALRGGNKDPGDSAMSRMIRNALINWSKSKASEVEKALKPDQHIVAVVRGQALERLVFDSDGNVRRYAQDAPIPSATEAPAAGSDARKPGHREDRE